MKHRKKKGIYSVGVKLNEEQYQILKNQARDHGMRLSECASYMLQAILYEMECTALEQEKIYGRRFSHPQDCNCCEGTPESQFH